MSPSHPERDFQQSQGGEIPVTHPEINFNPTEIFSHDSDNDDRRESPDDIPSLGLLTPQDLEMLDYILSEQNRKALFFDMMGKILNSSQRQLMMNR